LFIKSGREICIFKTGVALALFTALSLGSLSAQAYEQDKTYKITILHTNDHHGHFWRNDYGEYGWRRKNAGGRHSQRGGG
jgi:2',3'-cyclic-nucleotide 2'-phosphodiesterase (5'-nucleotidase family)